MLMRDASFFFLRARARLRLRRFLAFQEIPYRTQFGSRLLGGETSCYRHILRMQWAISEPNQQRLKTRFLIECVMKEWGRFDVIAIRVLDHAGNNRAIGLIFGKGDAEDRSNGQGIG